MQALLKAAGLPAEVAIPGGPAQPPGPQVTAAASGTFQDTNTTTWGLQAIGADVTTLTGAGVKVCVIDSGIDSSHPDVSGRAAGLTVRSFVGDAGQDLVGHGTHVAGTACGRRDGSLNYGVAPDAQLFVAKVINPQNNLAADGDILAAIDWAVSNGCQVANMSLSAPVEPGQSFSPVFEAAAQAALQKGTLLVAAAGNDSQRPGLIAPVGHPANCPSVLAVAALMPDLSVCAFSNGSVNSDGKIDVAGPGSFIFSSWPTSLPKPEAGIQQPPNPGYAFDQGTSMAAPHVTGVAALLSQKLGGVGGLALWQALVLGAVQAVPGLASSDIGFGLIAAPES
jgi:subtilisin family serine protease